LYSSCIGVIIIFFFYFFLLLPFFAFIFCQSQLVGRVCVWTPTHVRLSASPEQAEYYVVSMAAGASHTVVLTSRGLFGWGRNSLGQLGMGEGVSSAESPVSLILPDSCTSTSLAVVKCGANFTMLLSRNGLDLYCAGENKSGQLGLGEADGRSSFSRVDLSSFGRVLFFTLGSSFSLIVTPTGLYGCGKNDYGQIGEQSLAKSDVFRSVQDGMDGRFRFLGCGYHHALAVSEAQSFGWGRNDYGQLGFLPDGPLAYCVWKPKESPILAYIESQVVREKRSWMKVGTLNATKVGTRDKLPGD
jgi:alpha-tubulin suppressor-like RCC1 family protein